MEIWYDEKIQRYIIEDVIDGEREWITFKTEQEANLYLKEASSIEGFDWTDDERER